MKRILLLLWLFTLPAAAATHYVAASGVDSASGTTEAAPWLHAPGMTGCSGNCSSYTPVAGDSLIFRGGDTWHYSAGSPVGLPWNWGWSGTSANCNYHAGTTSSCIYLGVDQKWFSGTYWTRPIFSQDNAFTTSQPGSCSHDDTGLTALEMQGQSYVIVDNLEFSGKCWTGGSGGYSIHSYGTGNTFSNLYFHGWSLTAAAQDNNLMIGAGQAYGDNLVEYSVCDGSDSTFGTQASSQKASGYCFSSGRDYYNNYLSNVSNGFEGNFCNIHDNYFQYLYEPQGTQHGNVVESLPPYTLACNINFHNNTIVHANEGETVEIDPTPGFNVYYFNNVVADTANAIDCLIFQGQGTLGTSNYYVYDNTWDFNANAQGGTHGGCVISIYGLQAGDEFNGVLTFQGNHFINYTSNSLSSVWAFQGSSPPIVSSVVDNGGEVFQSESVANAQGYTLANLYQPTAGSNATVQHGLNGSTLCATFGTPLCSATSGGMVEVPQNGGQTSVSSPFAVVERPSSATWDAGAYQFALSIDAASPRQAINPLVYSMYNGQGSGSSPDPTFLANIKIPSLRWGGDGTTNYNWNVDTSNNGFDLYFLGGGSPTTGPGSQVDLVVQTQRTAYAASQPLVTIPIIPWITSTNTDLCSYTKVSVSGSPSYGTMDQYFPPAFGANPPNNCGRGKLGGVNLLDTDITYNYVANTTTIEQAWIAHLISRWGNCASGGVCLYQLDNEPGGWGGNLGTHFDVEPTEPDYGTIATLGIQYAGAIKSADTSANVVVLGPCDFGYYPLFSNSPSSTNLFPPQYYLQRFQTNDTSVGKRTLDYLDEHVGVGNNNTVADSFAQIRTFWDWTYFVPGGTGGNIAPSLLDAQNGLHGPIALIPRLQFWVNQFYPGTGVSFSEYEVQGTGNNLVDALVNTDAMAVFGYYGLALSNNFTYPQSSTWPTLAYSYYLFRDYDGAGGQFGNISVSSNSINQANLSVYGANRTTDGKVTVIAVNKTASNITSPLILNNFTASSAVNTYTYSGANLSAIVSGSTTLASGVVNYTFPAFSATEFVFSPGGGPPPPPTAAGPPNVNFVNNGKANVHMRMANGGYWQQGGSEGQGVPGIGSF